MLNAALSTGVLWPSAITVISHMEPYRLVLGDLEVKCLRSGIAVATEYT
ncbi:MAG: hypothetical protein ACTS73_01410 [Arsenophonus sp. NEOnobi-MAG3]